MNVSFGEWNYNIYNIPAVIRSISMKCLQIVLYFRIFISISSLFVVSLVDSVGLIEFSYQLLLNSVK